MEEKLKEKSDSEHPFPVVSIEESPAHLKKMSFNIVTERKGNEVNEKVESKKEHAVERRQIELVMDEQGLRKRRFSKLNSTGSLDSKELRHARRAQEFETRLKTLISAFSQRTERAKKIIRQPPTPSSSEASDSELSTEGGPNLKSRLQALLPSSSSPDPSFFGGEERRKSISEKIKGTCLTKWRILLRAASCKYCIDPQSPVYVTWLVILSSVLLYNAWVIPLRIVFPYQTEENVKAWMIADAIADIFYFIDMIAFKSHKKFIQNGFWVKDPAEARLCYIRGLQFKVDLISLCPADFIVALTYQNFPSLRLPRLLKAESFWELFRQFDSVLASPHSARIVRTCIHMLYLIHLMACAYYALSAWEGLGTTTWTFDNKGNAYIRCFYFATKTATSIGKNPKPEKEIEYLFMTFAWLSGVFVFALLIGQIRDIIATATRTQEEYREMTYQTVSYLHSLDVPKQLQERVKLWLTYTWDQQKTLDEGKILDLLPHRMRTDIALNLHVETLSKVQLFQNCEVAFLRDLVIKLRSIIFLPGDYICRKGEVGKTMYIIKSGRIDVVGGPNNTKILVTLGEGSVFGEIALLGIGGMNKRTADVRSAGFSNLFVLSKDDLNEAIKDYPDAQEIMRKKAKKLMKESARKAKVAAAAAIAGNEDSETSGPSNLPITAEIIITNKKEQPKLVNTVIDIFPASSNVSRYLTLGSKANSLTNDKETDILTFMTSYPPSPFIPDTVGNVSPEDDSINWSSSSSEKIVPHPENTTKNSPTGQGTSLKSQSSEFGGESKDMETIEPEENSESSSLAMEQSIPIDLPYDITSASAECTLRKEQNKEISNKYTRVLQSERVCLDRENIHVNLRPPVYPIIPQSSHFVWTEERTYSLDETSLRRKCNQEHFYETGNEKSSWRRGVMSLFDIDDDSKSLKRQCSLDTEKRGDMNIKESKSDDVRADLKLLMSIDSDYRKIPIKP